MTDEPKKPRSAVASLIVERMSQTLAAGGITAALGRIVLPGGLINHTRDARAWVEAAIKTVRGAPGNNPWRDATDEQIARTILDKIAEKRGSR